MVLILIWFNIAMIFINISDISRQQRAAGGEVLVSNDVAIHG